MKIKNKNVLIGGLLAIVLVMAVGYAAFATQLNINGTANITSNWNVHIKEIQVASEPEPIGTGTNKSTSIEDGNLTATFESELKAPGDSVTYDVTVINEGTLDAKLDSITFEQKNTGGEAASGNLTPEQLTNNPIVYTKTGIAEGDVLAHGGGTKTFKITVTYNPAITTQPTAEQLKNQLTMTLTYVQNIE